ncbi:MAG: hypothetical protein J6D33_08575 [Turicibacter sp.]|nr:hypothetical protein [Turicibacter sp.]
MQNISQAFAEAQKAPVRHTTAHVTFEMVDNLAYSNREISTTGQCFISNAEQLTNKIRRTDYNFATLEPDFFKLDGTFAIFDEGSNSNETGFVSDSIANEDGTFETPIVIELVFSNYINSPGLTVTFDNKLNEFAESFTIAYYNNQSLLHSESITNNDMAVFATEFGVENYNRFVLTVDKWNAGNRRARIVEVDFGLLKTFVDDELIKVDIVEELDTLNNLVATNELTFTIDNSERKFNVLNPNGIYRFLKNRQEITCEYGLKTNNDQFEFVQMGKFYLDEWKADEGALTVTFTAYDITKSLDGESYENNLSTTKSAYSLCQDILDKCGVQSYFIDDSLKDIMLNQKSEKITCKEALQMIGIASLSVVYQDRHGQLRIEPLDTIFKRERFLYYSGDDMAITGAFSPEIDQEAYSKTIDLDNVYKVPQITLSTPVERVEITYRVGEEDKFYSLNKGEIQTYSQVQVDNRTAILTNYFIATEEQASRVACWIMNELNLNAEYEITWRANPAFECGDTVFVEDGFNTVCQSRIIKQTYNYSGYLRGVTTTKGSV